MLSLNRLGCRALRAGLFASVCGVSFSAPVVAEVVSFAGVDLEIDATVGSGANRTVLVVDWDSFGGPYASASHAFLYQWDGEATVLDLLTALQDSAVFTFTTGFGGGFLNNIAYTDTDGDTHTNPVDGNWELASGTNPLGAWEGFDLSNPDWDFSVLGIDQELLVDGQFEGINAVFFDPNNNFERVGTALTVPIVPEPGTAALVACGALLFSRRARRAGALDQ